MSERQQYQPGYYKARGVAGSDQHGRSKDGGPQISLELDVQISDQETARLTTILAFAGKAGEFSIERLKSLGWTGSPDVPMQGIDANDVDVELKYESNPYKPNDPPRLKVEIKSGGGRFSFKQPMSDQERRGFMAELSKQAARSSGSVPAVASPRAPQGNGYPPSWDEGQKTQYKL